MKKVNKQKLGLNKVSCWSVWDDKTKKQVFDFSEKYKTFLNQAKTEREAVKLSIKMARAQGFVSWEEFVKLAKNQPIKNLIGKKVYFDNRNKSLTLVVLGKKLLTAGLNLLVSHIDCPRLDLKANPLYEDDELAYFKTHYYGGIKKYQWPTIALALHGTVVKANGEQIDICIGEKETDPIFMITDLLPHLGQEQMKKELGKAIEGEELNIVLGSMPVKNKKVKDKVKQAILEYLNQEYGLIEEDFISAEIQAVPSEKARDLGFDRSLIAGYGHDDRVNSFGILQAILDMKQSEKTVMTILADKEEIGSDGLSGMKSTFFEEVVEKLIKIIEPTSSVREIFSKTKALMADVTAAYDPDYRQVYETRNSARLNYGAAVERYTGYGGKYGTSEASAEFTGELRQILNKHKIIWQAASIGKVDQGGGGTMAMYLANRNIEVIDCGVPLLSMHAPLEIVSKGDIYSAYLAFSAFIQEA